ncbi:MAG: hypothetical protein AAF530_06785 [Pseudomonadota bacterium]
MCKNLVRIWRQASEDLGFEIIVPFELSIDRNISITAALLVKNFGYRNGMIVISDYKVVEPYKSKIVGLGYGYSTFSEFRDSEKYDRASYIDILSDWTWAGADHKKPSWVKDDCN